MAKYRCWGACKLGMPPSMTVKTGRQGSLPWNIHCEWISLSYLTVPLIRITLALGFSTAAFQSAQSSETIHVSCDKSITRREGRACAPSTVLQHADSRVSREAFVRHTTSKIWQTKHQRVIKPSRKPKRSGPLSELCPILSPYNVAVLLFVSRASN